MEDEIRKAKTPLAAHRKGRDKKNFQHLRKDWPEVKEPLMESILLAKFQQNLDILKILLETKVRNIFAPRQGKKFTIAE